MTNLVARYTEWLFAPLPRSRVAWLRTFVYAFIFVDVFILRPWVSDNGYVSAELYHPLMIGRLLPLPVPTPEVVAIVKYALLASAAVALAGRLPRAAGAAVFLLYVEWMVIAFSYGKVDHDRFAFLVALAVLPTVGRTSWRDSTADQAAGWAIHCVQAAVVATYFLAAWAKFRFGGIDWLTGATLTRAILRRGTPLADPLLDHHYVLQVAQILIVAFELGSPLMLMRNMVGRVYVAGALLFHLITFAAITILFWPHVVCLLAFLRLERLGRVRLARPAPAT
ncbi:MAG: MFS transporter permease [Actinomycetota bacterium]|nr:MFS transporter permease [Actinomycetota bacterium]